MRALLDGEVTVEIDTRGGFHVLMAEPDLASADGGHTDRRIFALTSANVGSPTSCSCTTLVIRARSSVGDGVGAGCQVEIFGGSGRSSAARMVFWSAVLVVRCATRPSAVASTSTSPSRAAAIACWSPGTARSRRPAAPVRPGPPARRGRSCGSPSRSARRRPGDARCAPAANNTPPTRRGSSAWSPAGTYLH